MYAPDSYDNLPDVRDGLTRRERIVLWCLNTLQKERGDLQVPTSMLYGSVVEHVAISVEEMQRILVRCVGYRLLPSSVRCSLCCPSVFSVESDHRRSSMQTRLSPAQHRHLQRYADGDNAFKNTRSEHGLLALGFIARCDQIVRYTETVTWTIYKAHITPEGQRYLEERGQATPGVKG